MMRLEQVDISGFKSFCDRQELSFKGGQVGKPDFFERLLRGSAGGHNG